MNEKERIRSIINNEDSIKPVRVFDYEYVPDAHHGARQGETADLILHNNPERPDVMLLILSRKPPGPNLPCSTSP